MRSVSIFLLLALFATSARANEPESVSVETIESVQQGVIPIVCSQTDENNNTQVKQIMGTGFFINQQGYFLTAAHVITAMNTVTTEDNPCIPAIYVPQVSWKTRSQDTGIRLFTFVDCLGNEATDVAVCKPSDNPFLDPSVNNNVRWLPFNSFAGYSDGSPIAFTGFPLDIMFPVTSKGYIASYLPFSKQILIDKNAWPGASGSPLYDTQGKVIGLVIKTGIDESTGLSFARPADFLLDFLRTNQIPIEE